MRGYYRFASGMALAIAIGVMATAVVASGSAGVRPLVKLDDGILLDDYFAQVRQSGMAHVQMSEPQDRPSGLDLEEEEAVPAQGTKSPMKAFVYSLVLPGAGQLYTGSKLKAVAFFGLEVLSWSGYILYHGKGDDKTGIYEAFADAHWSEIRYGDFLYLNWGVRDDDSVYDDLGYPYFTHHLPDTKTQQYYEMIGKYDQFVFGWDDTDLPPDSGNLSRAYLANRHHYEGLRHDANVMYGRATASLVVVMVNHIISGAEAALAARRHNNKMQEGEQRLSVRAVTGRLDDTYFPMLTMTYRF